MKTRARRQVSKEARAQLGGSIRRGLGRARRIKPSASLPKLSSIPGIPIIREAIGRSREVSVEGLSPAATLHASYNFRMGVFNGVMFTLVEALIAPSLVLAWFVSRLGAPNVLVGLLPAILAGGWFLPQILVAGRVQGLRRVMPWYTRVGYLRAVSLGLLAVATVAFADQQQWLLAAFFFFYILYAFMGGITGIHWLEIVGKVISPRRRGSFFGLRSFWGGVLALLAAGPIATIMSERFLGLVFPYNFALLYGLAAICVLIGVWAWSSIREPETVQLAEPTRMSRILKRGFEVLRIDQDYRSFMVARVLVSLAAVADPFYIIYAKNNLAAPPATIGLYLGALSISSLLSNFLWSPLADRAGNRTLMTWTVVSTGLVPLSALVISLLIGVAHPTFLFSAFSVVFVLSGIALGAARIVNNNMMLTIAPPAERPTYIAFLNLVLGIVIFVPVLGGLLADFVGFRVLFVLSALLAGAALIASFKMSTRRAA